MVLDTNVVVSGMRSPLGASAKLVDQALTRRFTPILSVPLALEYEAKCSDPSQLAVFGLNESEVQTVVATLCAVSDSVAISFLWRPKLRDASDEMVLEAAVDGSTEAIVTFNKREFGDVPREFGIAVITPQGALRRLLECRRESVRTHCGCLLH